MFGNFPAQSGKGGFTTVDRVCVRRSEPAAAAAIGSTCHADVEGAREWVRIKTTAVTLLYSRAAQRGILIKMGTQHIWLCSVATVSEKKGMECVVIPVSPATSEP
jgi:hypothetical protein